GGGSEAAWVAIPHGRPLHRRYGVWFSEDLRHRGLAARPEDLSRDFLLLGLRRLPGKAHECTLPLHWRKTAALRPHLERLRRGGRPGSYRGNGKLPERGW